MSKHTDLVRYCPNCGSVGKVDAIYRDCCPDGNESRQIPKDLAEKLQSQFKLLITFHKETDKQKGINAELLEALELIAGEHREDAATWMRGVARAAIAKARGEANE